jgi:DNA-binding NtrC family response regulator
MRDSLLRGCGRLGKGRTFVSARKTTRRSNKVLIVRGDDDLRLLLQFLLEADGFQVAVSRTPELAMQTLLRDQPEAIFFDLHGNSLSLLEFIQQTCPTISIFTVVRSEHSALAGRSVHGGAQAFLSTPVDYRGVKTLLEGSSAARKPVGPQSSLCRRRDSSAVASS